MLMIPLILNEEPIGIFDLSSDVKLSITKEEIAELFSIDLTQPDIAKQIYLYWLVKLKSLKDNAEL